MNKGDTLDALPLSGDRVALLVADVVGNGFAAAIAVSQIKAVIRERLAAGVDLREVMMSADRYAFDHPEVCATSACVAILSLADGELEWCTAGHPSPVRMTPGAPAELLSSRPSRPLGAGGSATVHRSRLQMGETLGLYTNGLVHSPGHTIAEGYDRLLAACATATSAQRPAAGQGIGESLCDDILRETLTVGGSDDATLLIATRTTAPESFRLHMSAVPENLPLIRHRINGWLDNLGAGLMDHVGLGHAVVELAANVVAHAYVDSGSDAEPVVNISAGLGADGVVAITVSDRGRWRTRPSSGRGLMMAAGLADSLKVDRSHEGTTVTLTQRLTRPVPLLQEVAPESENTLDVPEELETYAEPGLMAAIGPVDELSVDLFDAALTRATRAGTADAVIDLTGITHLASPGIQTLFDYIARSKRTGTTLSLRAPATSPAGQILKLVDLSTTSALN
nr:SpoIIE family protein phosphatase [Nocardioides daedukensis]